ncbi:MAG: hypothetical protein PHQ75_10225, partial [Thermoguttaceae bacterium]|nr:hypothetical protein [Thermoguttaceae bacterium]
AVELIRTVPPLIALVSLAPYTGLRNFYHTAIKVHYDQKNTKRDDCSFCVKYKCGVHAVESRPSRALWSGIPWRVIRT